MPDSPDYQIDIRPMPQYIPEQSDPEVGRYIFTYTITIRNNGRLPAQLIARHWIITDGHNEVQEVRGLGVIGQQPLIKPGESYEYTSGCVLPTPIGSMRGSYQMVGEDGNRFDVDIPEFVLAAPHQLH